MVFRSGFFVLSLVTPLLLWLSFPGGGGLWPFLFIALVPLFIVIAKGSRREVIGYGLVCGFIHFILLLYWIVIVLGRYGGLHWSIAVMALLLLAFCLALYFSLFAILARYIFLVLPAGAVLWLLPSLWVGIDWLRGILLTGMPWMDLGYGLWAEKNLIQIADLFGHHGLTWMIVFVNTLFVILLTRKVSGYSRSFMLLSFVVVLGSVAIYSGNRLQKIESSLVADDVKSMRVGIVQGNIDQSVKWSASQRQGTIDKYLSQSRSLLGTSPPELLVWPETALPFYPKANTQMAALRDLTSRYDIALLTGAPWYEIVDRQARKVNYFNSALLLDPAGQFSGKYYKTHLVPFGEYIPYKSLLPFLAPVVEAVGDFSPGKIEKPLVWREVRAGVLICFESVFPELARKWVLSGANVLVNLTNDAWYGKSSAPHQSLAMSVLRAVETRRSVVRAANTGISAFIDPLGRVESPTELFQPDALAADVILLDEVTFWVRYGYLFAPLCLLFGVAAALVAGMRRRYH